MRKKRICCMFLLVILCSLLVLRCSAAETGSGAGFAGRRSAQDIIREIVNAYWRNGETSHSAVNAALEELAQIDEDLSGKWKRIMDYWQYADRDMALNSIATLEGLPEDDTLCIVILGYQLNVGGSLQPELIGRLERGLECIEDYPNAYVLCTGGPTASGNTTVTEAGQMAAWLEEHGVAADRILTEDRSLTTTQNAKYSWELLHASCPQVSSILLVTSNYHISWSAVLFETECILQEDIQKISVAANAAYDPPQPLNYNVRSSQALGILELAGLGYN